LVLPFALLAGGTASEVRLMLPPLGVREVRAVILVDGQAEAALKATDMVLEEVRIFVEVDGFEGEFAEPFASVCVCCGVRGDAAAPEFRTCAVLLPDQYTHRIIKYVIGVV
jgi:hypothetical protein